MGMNLGSSGGGRRRRYQPMAEMNVTPMVDVMLVLLIIFMVAAPMLTQGVQVALPQAEAASIAPDQPVELTLTREGRILIGSREVPQESLIAQLQTIQAERDNAAVLVRADGSLEYAAVMQVMAALQAAGMVDVGLVTAPTQ